MRFDVKTKRVLRDPYQLSMAVFTSFLKLVVGLPTQRDPQVYRTLFWAESLKGGELSNFLDLSVDDVFRIAVVQ